MAKTRIGLNDILELQEDLAGNTPVEFLELLNSRTEWKISITPRLRKYLIKSVRSSQYREVFHPFYLQIRNIKIYVVPFLFDRDPLSPIK